MQRGGCVKEKNRGKRKSGPESFKERHGVPCYGRLAGGALVFIAEIVCGGKLNLPADSLTPYNGDVNCRLGVPSFLGLALRARP
jgi:hypothetical protein